MTYHKTKKEKPARGGLPPEREETIQVRRKGIMNQKQTQCKKIVEYIRANGHITSLEAAKYLNITQLCARIIDLESRGFVFNKPKFKVGNCKNPVAHYSIARSGIEP
uniref:Helix-turn-helix domain protein n=1 Tax=Podoviridae sp. ct8mF2 TaxID=2825224 RepID=A0A8S5PMJ0_9CAUD|nr:MAG TPA: helix-turn-helix domain protein [Podoviridae sp. ct8mF2]